MLEDAERLREVTKAITRVMLNGGDPDQYAVRWNGTEMEPQDFPAWRDYLDFGRAAIAADDDYQAQGRAVCPECGGDGIVVISRGHFSDGSENNEEHECPTCGGTGRTQMSG